MNDGVTTSAENQAPAMFVYHGYTGADARQALETEKKLGRILLWAAYISGFAAAIALSSWVVASFLVLTLLVAAALGQVGKPGDTTGFD